MASTEDLIRQAMDALDALSSRVDNFHDAARAAVRVIEMCDDES